MEFVFRSMGLNRRVYGPAGTGRMPADRGPADAATRDADLRNGSRRNLLVNETDSFSDLIGIPYWKRYRFRI
jgi:hypothetical protein